MAGAGDDPQKARARPVRARALLELLVKVWVALVLALIVGTDLLMPGLIENSDYVANFYAAGRLAATGRWQELYPPAGATSLTGTPFDVFAHALLPGLSPYLVALFMHAPLVALIFSPLSAFDPNVSLLSWQLVCVVALAVSVFAVLPTGAERWRGMWWIFAFVPVSLTVWVGQLGIVFGLLPFALSYYLVVRGKPFCAGIALSVSLLKPQLALIALMPAATLAAAGSIGCLVGLLTGAALLLAVNYWIGSPELMSQWLGALRMRESLLTAHTVPFHLIASLPETVLLYLPSDGAVKAAVYASCAAQALIGFLFCVRLARSGVAPGTTAAAAFLVALVATPLASPYLNYYDLSTMALAGLLYRAVAMPEDVRGRLGRLIWVVAVWISLYGGLFFVWTVRLAHPALLLLPLMVLYWRLLPAVAEIGRRDG